MGQIQSIPSIEINFHIKNTIRSLPFSNKAPIRKTITVVVDNIKYHIPLRKSITIGFLVSEVNRYTQSKRLIVGLRTKNGLEIMDFLLVSYEKTTEFLIEKDTLFPVYYEKASVISEIQNFHPIKVIGKGGYSTVTLVRKKDSGMLYALKTVSKKYIINKNKSNQIVNEKIILSKVSHPFIIKFITSFQSVKYI